MSIVNLHKKFVCKIVETGYFAEKPARASVKGRPKKYPHLRTDGGILPALTSAQSSKVSRRQLSPQVVH